MTKCKKKALTPAEKQRRYREKRREDTERDTAYKEKRKLRNAKRKKVDEMSNRQHRIAKKNWRVSSAAYRERKAQKAASTPIPEISQSKSRQNKQGRKSVLKNRSKVVRENKKLQKHIEALENLLHDKDKKIQKYKKRYTRASVKVETPKSKVKRLLKSLKVNKINSNHKVARTLVFHDILTNNLKTAYTKLTSARDRRMIGKTISSQLSKKYRLQSTTAHSIGLKCKKRFYNKARSQKFTEKYKKIEQFFLRDDVSHSTAGKKETRTKDKLKMQKRFLLDSMQELYKKFCDEKIHNGVSYTVFTRCRPFYVLKPTDYDRDTCRCVKHANLEFIACKLHQMKCLPTANLHLLTSFLACDKNNYNCMFNICSDSTVPITIEDPEQEVSWRKWSTIKEERHKIKNGVQTQFFVKVHKIMTIHGTLNELNNSFQNSMKIFKSHCFKIRHQNKTFKECKEQLSATEAALLIDFSENYNYKLHEEIQNYHFGASRHQATLHTGVLYIKDINPIPFSSISPSNEHGPSAIWAHLHPILDFLHNEFPTVQIIHFFSDGPSSQYRQRKNFYLFSTQTFDLGFKAATWSFFESGHGKGAADGIGATLKRLADQIVAHGTNIPDAETLFDVLQSKNLKVKLFFIPEEKIVNYLRQIPSNLRTVPGTHSIHQIITVKHEEIFHRNVSCFCEENKWAEGKFCNCSETIRKVSLNEVKNIQDLKRKRPIYSSESDNDSLISSFDIQNSAECSVSQPKSVNNLQPGTYVLVKVVGINRNKTCYRYVGVIQECDEDDGELKVVFFRVTDEKGQMFRLLEEDISYVEYNQVIRTLPSPQIVMKGNRMYYRFPFSIDVYEKT